MTNTQGDNNHRLVLNTHALVLEGGAMRGVFTAGVLDYFMDHAIEFPYVVGVSAGACNAVSYVSNQRGRSKESTIGLLKKYDYMGLKHLIKQHNYLDFDLLFDKVPNRLLPFDFGTYANRGIRLEMVTSNCLTGKAEYHEEYSDFARLLTLLRASSSMPLFSPIVNVDGTPMLDGGVCDSIPAQRALDSGYEKMVIIQTRNKGYRKRGSSLRAPRWIYREYPNFREAINQRNDVYNAQLDLVDKLEDEGKAIVIRPTEPITIKRTEKNIDKLLHFYHHGYECAAQLSDCFAEHVSCTGS